jgi:flavodoxin
MTNKPVRIAAVIHAAIRSYLDASVVRTFDRERGVPMPRAESISRRDSFKAVLLPLAATGFAVSTSALQAQGDGRSVVVYLSRSGNTRVLAGALSRRFVADLFEVRPRDPWPADYDEMVAWATRMREDGGALPLAGRLTGIAGYRIVFLGFPIWGRDLPAVMAGFLRSHDLSGKTVVPFITHGGYGPGDAMQTLDALVPDARIVAPFILECDQERDTLRELNGWLSDVENSL